MFSSIAREIKEVSENKDDERVVQIVGYSSALRRALARAARFARMSRHVLITGESGVGKELFAKAIYLLGPRRTEEFYTVNCAQYQNEELLVSELFGHERGSFTGATSSRRGLFDRSDGGIVFLDEVGELSPQAQAMLLRVLGEGEIKRLGSSRAKYIDVKVITATNRILREMVKRRTFRKDLYYRLKGLSIHIPPVRDRGNDWELLVQFFLDQRNRTKGTGKRLSREAWGLMEKYHWPGNVREIENVVDLGYCLAEDELIGPEAFEEMISSSENASGTSPYSEDQIAGHLYREMVEDEKSFWEVIRKPYMNRDLNRAQVKAVMRRGLRDTGGSYKQLLKVFSVEDDNYLKFMDFLRHHDLKPERDQLFGLSDR
jgi:two-component system response regulator AtoC